LAVFQLHNVSKSFGKKEIINDVSFTLKTGEILGIFGRNGCGKSTLLKMIFGTEKSDSINISIEGKAFLPSKNIQNQQVAYLPQHPFLPKNLKVRDVIPIYFQEEKKQDAVFYDALIAKIAEKKVGELSMGQLRYFEVLLIGNLEHLFLMLDEPFSMIEPLYKVHIKEFLNRLKEKKGIIITDHYYEDVLDITSQNIIIKDGKSQNIKTKEELTQFQYLSKNSI
jgi:ABC-type multidrug transport system ATPase subunit